MVFVIRHVVMTAQHPYSVANSLPCRNNSDKNLANFLESAQQQVHTLFVHFCINLVFSYLISNVAYGVR